MMTGNAGGWPHSFAPGSQSGGRAKVEREHEATNRVMCLQVQFGFGHEGSLLNLPRKATALSMIK